MFIAINPGTLWAGGEIDAAHIAAEGIVSAVGRHEFTDVEVHGMRSSTFRAIGVRLEGTEGSRVSRCHIYDLHAVGDSNPGNARGAVRGILGTHTQSLTYPHEWTDNVIHDVWGEEGDGMQMLYYNGTLPMLSAAQSIVGRNKIYGCGRRALKIQASNVIIRDNDLRLGGGSRPASQSEIPAICVMNILDAEGCTVSDNSMVSDVPANVLMVSMAATAALASGNSLTRNLFVGDSGFDAVFLNRQTAFNCSDNEFRGGRGGLVIGYSKRGALTDNRFVNSLSAGTYADISVNNTNEQIVVSRNVALGGAKDRMVNAGASLCVYRDNSNLRDEGTGVFVSGSIEAVIDGTASTSSGAAVLSSIDSARISDSVNLGSGAVGFGASVFFANGDPANTRAGRRHQLGDICYNSTAGATVGWRCIAPGTPGVWAAFS